MPSAQKGDLMTVNRTTPYGFQLSDGSFRNATEAVRNFAKDKLPAKVKVEDTGEKGAITRISFPQVEESGQSVDSTNKNTTNVESKQNYWEEKKKSDSERQESIKAQFCVREALKAIELNNQIPENDKLKPTRSNILETAKLVESVIDELVKGSELPDY